MELLITRCTKSCRPSTCHGPLLTVRQPGSTHLTGQAGSPVCLIVEGPAMLQAEINRDLIVSTLSLLQLYSIPRGTTPCE
jgi:hypothetical protein